TICGLLYGPQTEALLAFVRDGSHVGRIAAAGRRAQLRRAAVRGGAAWAGVVDISPRVVASGADRLGRPAWACAIAVSGRWKRGFLARTAAGRFHRGPARPVERRLVFARGIARNRGVDRNWRMVQASDGGSSH